MSEITNQYEYCILTDENEIIEYEKGLYQAFVEKSPDQWIINNYTIIDNFRLRTKIPYNDQEICAIKNNQGKIVCAAAANFNKNNLQLESIGFKLSNSEKQKKFCEGLNFYNLEPFSIDYQKTLQDFFKFIHHILTEKGFVCVYTTCPERIKFLYVYHGYTIIDSLLLYGNKELLLKIENSNKY